MGNCGEEHAFYSAEKKQVIPCNDLIGRFAVLSN
jgi:hypothetical protein